jgi:hypothetical protein
MEKKRMRRLLAIKNNNALNVILGSSSGRDKLCGLVQYTIELYLALTHNPATFLDFLNGMVSQGAGQRVMRNIS